tara:strand:- start:81 stop:290 length:210 start_codon:yes stop_codon:yes gene_type:complete
MQIGGAEFTMGVARDTDDLDDFTMALKCVVFGMNMEDTETVFQALSKTLLELDSELEIEKVTHDKTNLN